MKNLPKMKLYGIMLIALVMSCSDDFIDITPEKSLTENIFFASQRDFELAINGAYAPLRTLHNGAGGFGVWAMGEMRSDNTHYKFNVDNRGSQFVENIADFLFDPRNVVVEAHYVTSYLTIARANQLLSVIDNADFDASVKNNIKGQALYLRALSYLDLVQYYGEVPLHLIPVTSREDAALPLSSVEEIYSQITADVTEAIGLLPQKSAQEEGRATSGAAQMLLGNLQIIQKNWPAAAATFKAIIDSGEYQLQADYAAVFSVSNKNNSESIFEVQFLEGTQGAGSTFIYDMLPAPLTNAQVAEITGVPNSNSITVESWNHPTPDLIASYEPGDLRKDISIGLFDVNGTVFPYVKKLLQPHSIPGITGANWPVYRYAEALLFYAEVLNESGDSGNAENFLNQVRTRAGLAPVSGLGQGALRDAILQERRVELAFENKRWFDLVRSGTAQSVMLEYGQRVKDNPADYYYPPGISAAPNSYLTIELLFPIPAEEVRLNPFF